MLNAQEKIIYVGQAKNIHKRWNNGHHKLSNIIAECGTDTYIDCVAIPEWLLN